MCAPLAAGTDEVLAVRKEYGILRGPILRRPRIMRALLERLLVRESQTRSVIGRRLGRTFLLNKAIWANGVSERANVLDLLAQTASKLHGAFFLARASDDPAEPRQSAGGTIAPGTGGV